uniref:4-hydroxythreonine-4-phosphate dehydrogenase PdxA n=1 Tax=Roseihalotalea indica TaxID=2867963 RepID=A0AA49GJR5_9BACT|nr:4-hydroxythreonine-4-phosphate dehydrogenase PdxA [Tunicatimonas sp. TK19036]
MNRTDTTLDKPIKPKTKRKKGDLLVIGISLGDVNGVGPEVIIKALSDKRILNQMTPIVFGSAKVISYYRKQCNLDQFNFMTIKDLDSIAFGKVNVYNCWQETVEIQEGKVTEPAGKAAWQALEQATQALQSDVVAALVTAPINKNNIQNEEFSFPGHTEYLAKTFEVEEHLMFLVHENLRIGVVTGHIPLHQVSQKITRSKVRLKIKIMEESLKTDFGILKPKIAVLGLNPHAGEEGLLGSEEQDILLPVINELKNKGKLIYGPFPSDGFFGAFQHQQFDGVLAMYHDQGLIPFKTLAFEKGVNFTAGLPIVRTSPDHGTAYNIAGKNQANEASMREALYLACDIVRQRQELLEDDE